MGHTHNELDAEFGQLSIAVYGKNGTTPRDILSFTQFDNICKDVYGDRLLSICDIRAVHDWDVYCRGYRPKSVDVDIQTQHALTFELRDSTVFVRSKSAVRDSVPWSRYIIPIPHQRHPHPSLL